MNGDPYRTPQPADRRVINRSGQAQAAYQRGDEPGATLQEEPAPATRSRRAASKPEKQSSKKGLWWTIVIVLVAVSAVLGWLAWSNAHSGDDGIKASRYQAVFLVNGQIYFGKLEDVNEKSFKLKNIYYPQAQSSATDGSESEAAKAQPSGIQLIKLGDEVHGPESEMYISKDQILYYENLKADSKVSQLIDQNEKAK